MEKSAPLVARLETAPAEERSAGARQAVLRKRPRSLPSCVPAPAPATSEEDREGEPQQKKARRVSHLPSSSEAPDADARVAAPVPCAFNPRSTLVKVGESKYMRLDKDWKDISDMDDSALLKVLQVDSLYSATLDGVALSRCNVFILKGALPGGKFMPDASDEAPDKMIALEGIKKVGDAVDEGKCSGNHLFICVRLPGTPGAALATLKACADKLKALRSTLRERSPLEDLTKLTLDSAGLTPLAAPSDDGSAPAAAPSLAQFVIPAIPVDVVKGPKGFERLLAFGGPFMLETGRLGLSKEFVGAMDSAVNSSFGVLLSGPKGIGKSAVGVLSFLSCVAEGKLVVYIPNSLNWVEAARVGQDDAFFFCTFLRQNADLVLADRELLGVFEPLMRYMDGQGAQLFDVDSISSETATATMHRLTRAVNLKCCGLIVDETQKITEATDDSFKAFRAKWHGWQSDCGPAFVRMDIASSHGLRELTLPSGDNGRLRFVRPWAREVVMDFLGAPASPGFLSSPPARTRVHYICGGVVRSLLEAREMVGLYGSEPDRLDLVETTMRERMRASCDVWMNESSADIVALSASAITNLMRGSAEWRTLKPAYDHGLVALAPTNESVVPVSSVAASVLHQALARYVMKHLVPLDTIDNGGARGIELEKQVHAALDGRCVHGVPTHSLVGSRVSPTLTLRSDYALPFLTAKEAVSAATASVLYLPKSQTYPCDAILVPPTCYPDAPVVLIKASVTHPTDSHRLTKLLGWFGPAPPPRSPASKPQGSTGRERAPEESGGFIQMVKDTHPGRRVFVVLCWPGSSESSEASAGVGASQGSVSASTGGSGEGTHRPSKKQELMDVATAAGVTLCVVDTPGLEVLGLRLTA